MNISFSIYSLCHCHNLDTKLEISRRGIEQEEGRMEHVMSNYSNNNDVIFIPEKILHTLSVDTSYKVN